MNTTDILNISVHAVIMCVLLRDMCKSVDKKDLYGLIYDGFLFLAVVINFSYTKGGL